MNHARGVGLGIGPSKGHVVLGAHGGLEADLDLAGGGVERPAEAVGVGEREAVVEHGGHGGGGGVGGAVGGEEDVAEVGGGVGVEEREQRRERAGEGEAERGVAEGGVERERGEGQRSAEGEEQGRRSGHFGLKF